MISCRLFRSSFLSVSYLTVFALLIISCQSRKHNPTHSQEMTTFQGIAMTIPYSIIIGEAINEEKMLKIKETIEKTFQDIDVTYNKWNPHSEISQLNTLQQGIKVKLSPELYALLLQCSYFHQLSQGKFDPSIESLQSLWKKHLDSNQVPSQQSLDAIRPAIGWHNIHLDDGYFWKDCSLTSIDLGAIAKGLCVDFLTERIQALKIENIYTEWGGEIRTLGKHPSGRPWRIYISNLEDTNPDNALAYINLSNKAIATSGDYLQTWKIQQSNAIGDIEEVTYSHIIDLNTLCPIKSSDTSIASASVVADNCVIADCLATIILLSENLERAQEMVKTLQQEYPTARFWIATRKQSRYFPAATF